MTYKTKYQGIWDESLREDYNAFHRGDRSEASMRAQSLYQRTNREALKSKKREKTDEEKALTIVTDNLKFLSKYIPETLLEELRIRVKFQKIFPNLEEEAILRCIEIIRDAESKKQKGGTQP